MKNRSIAPRFVATALLAVLSLPGSAFAFNTLRDAVNSTRGFCPESAVSAMLSTSLLNGRVQIAVDLGIGETSRSFPYAWNTYSALDSCRYADRPVIQLRHPQAMSDSASNLRANGADHQLVLSQLTTYIQILESSGFLNPRETLKIEMKISSGASSPLVVDTLSLRLSTSPTQRVLLMRSFERPAVPSASSGSIDLSGHSRAVLTTVRWLQQESLPMLYRAQR